MSRCFNSRRFIVFMCFTASGFPASARPALGTPGAYFTTPAGLVPFREGLRRAMRPGADDPFLRHKDVLSSSKKQMHLNARRVKRTEGGLLEMTPANHL